MMPDARCPMPDGPEVPVSRLSVTRGDSGLVPDAHGTWRAQISRDTAPPLCQPKSLLEVAVLSRRERVERSRPLREADPVFSGNVRGSGAEGDICHCTGPCLPPRACSCTTPAQEKCPARDTETGSETCWPCLGFLSLSPRPGRCRRSALCALRASNINEAAGAAR